MATITDYASLVAAITTFSHRGNLATYVDYLIQQAQEQVERDIPDLNVGDYIRFQEAAYPAVTTDGNGQAPVPADWLASRLLKVTGNGITKTLLFKSPAYIYARYPMRTPDSMPAVVAREVYSGGSSWPAAPSSLTFIATGGQTVFSLSAGPVGVPVLFVAQNGALIYPTTDYTVSNGQLTLTNPATAGDDILVQYVNAGSIAAPAVSGTNVLIFGPFPDQGYTVSGTYYQKAPALSSVTTTNWMVTNAPGMLLAACMVQAGLFIPDDKLIARWDPLYQRRLKALVDADRTERWGSGPLVGSTF